MSKTRVGVIAAALAGIFLCACGQQTSEVSKNAAPANNAAANATAAKVDPKVVEAIKEMLTAHDNALNDHNVDGVMATFSTDPKVVLLGTGKGERFVGTEAIKNAYTEIVKGYDKGSFVPGCQWKEGGVDDSGKMAWFAATCDAKDTVKGAPREYTLNVSASAVKEAAGWRFIMMHMSNVTDPGPPPADAKNPPPANAANKNN